MLLTRHHKLMNSSHCFTCRHTIFQFGYIYMVLFDYWSCQKY